MVWPSCFFVSGGRVRSVRSWNRSWEIASYRTMMSKGGYIVITYIITTVSAFTSWKCQYDNSVDFCYCWLGVKVILPFVMLQMMIFEQPHRWYVDSDLRNHWWSTLSLQLLFFSVWLLLFLWHFINPLREIWAALPGYLPSFCLPGSFNFIFSKFL